MVIRKYKQRCQMTTILKRVQSRKHSLPPGHPIIYCKIKLFKMAAVSVKRSIPALCGPLHSKVFIYDVICLAKSLYANTFLNTCFLWTPELMNCDRQLTFSIGHFLVAVNLTMKAALFI